jgi:hypothetical protein
MEVYNTWYGMCVVHGEGSLCGEVKGEISGCGGGMWNTVSVTHYDQAKHNLTLARACKRLQRREKQREKEKSAHTSNRVYMHELTA